MQFIGPVILLIWFILTTIIYMTMTTGSKRRTFTYKALFWGSRSWEKNNRNWLLILGLFSLIVLTPITNLFIFFILLGCYTIILAGLSSFLHLGSPHQDLLAIIFSIILIAAASAPYISHFI